MVDHYEVELTKDIIMKIDKEYLELVEKYALCADHGYCKYHDTEIKKSHLFHHLVMKFDKNANKCMVIDHINGDRTDNRK